MPIFGPGMAFKGIPEPMPSISTIYCINPTHLDPIHPQNIFLPTLFVRFLSLSEIATWAKFIPAFLANGGCFELSSTHHEIRQEKLVWTKLVRGPGRTGELRSRGGSRRGMVAI